MNKTISRIKGVVMSQIVERHYEGKEGDKTRNMLLEGIRNTVEDDGEAAVNNLFAEMKMRKENGDDLEFVWYKEIYGFIKCSLSVFFCWHLFKRSADKNEINIGDDDFVLKKLQSLFKKDDDGVVDYEFVWFNAWLYSGNDNLWAGLIRSLYSSVEEHFGSSYVHAKQRAELLIGAFKILSAGATLVLSLSYFRDNSMTMSYDELDPDNVDDVKSSFEVSFE